MWKHWLRLQQMITVISSLMLVQVLGCLFCCHTDHDRKPPHLPIVLTIGNGMNRSHMLLSGLSTAPTVNCSCSTTDAD